MGKTKETLEHTHPHLVAQWHPMKNDPLSPTDVTHGSNKVVWWVCDEGHEWDVSVKRKIKARGCPYCTNKRVLPGFNDLNSQRPQLAALWHPTFNKDLSPDQLSPFSWKTVWWQCDKGHEWSGKPVDISEKCGYCTGKKLLVDFNDLGTTYPDLAAQWHPSHNADLTPSDLMSGTDKRVWWLCEKGHEWATAISHRVRGSNCPYCAGQRTIIGTNDLETMRPEIAVQWHPTKNLTIKPSSVMCGSVQKAWWQCEKGHEWEAKIADRTRTDGAATGCPDCFYKISRMESQLSEWVISQLGEETEIITSSRKIIPPYELDIYVPAKNIAIEFNGIYWHSEKAGKKAGYHHKKWALCRDQGVQLIQVWEDDWRDRPGIVKSMILHKLGLADLSERVFARKCKIINVPRLEAQEFLNSHHLQGFVSGSYYLGLRSKDDDKLAAIMVLKKQGQDMLLARYATAVPVPGGQSKIVKHAEENLDYFDLITFADLEVSDGALYEKTGFHKDRKLPPDYSYMYENRRQHKFGFRLARFRSDPQLKYEEGLSERELALLNNIPRIWDSGKIRYVKTRPKKP